MFRPLTHSDATDDDAIAEPQPKVLNLASTTLPSSSTLIWSFITSPQAGAPTRPVPTVGSFLSSDPTFSGFSKWSITSWWYPRRAPPAPRRLTRATAAPARDNMAEKDDERRSSIE